MVLRWNLGTGDSGVDVFKSTVSEWCPHLSAAIIDRQSVKTTERRQLIIIN